MVRNEIWYVGANKHLFRKQRVCDLMKYKKILKNLAFYCFGSLRPSCVVPLFSVYQGWRWVESEQSAIHRTGVMIYRDNSKDRLHFNEFPLNNVIYIYIYICEAISSLIFAQSKSNSSRSDSQSPCEEENFQGGY